MFYYILISQITNLLVLKVVFLTNYSQYTKNVRIVF